MAANHLDGKRTGRPKGSKNKTVPADLRRDLTWAYKNLSQFRLKNGTAAAIDANPHKAPSAAAMLWIRYGLKHPERFLDRIAKLALTEAKNQDKHEPQPPGRDIGTESAIRLCELCLEDYERQRAEEDAELARRPDAAQIGATLQATLTEALRRESVLRQTVDKLRKQVADLQRADAAHR